MDCLTPCRNRIPRPRVFYPAPKPPPAAGTFSPGLRQKNGRFLPPLPSSGRISCAHRTGRFPFVRAHPFRLVSIFRPGAYHAPTERDRERSKTPGKLSHRGRTLCAPTERDASLSSGRIPCAQRTGPGTVKTTGAALSLWAHTVRPYGAGRFPFVRAHTMRPQNGTNHDQKHRESSLTVGALCAPRRIFPQSALPPFPPSPIAYCLLPIASPPPSPNPYSLIPA